MAESRKPTSPFAERVENPYRFGSQYVVFDLLRRGYTRMELLDGLIEEEVRKQTQGETRDAKALLDKVLHDLRKRKGIPVVHENDGYRILKPKIDAQAGDVAVEQGDVRESPPAPPADSAVAMPESTKHTAVVAPLWSEDDYTIIDVTDFYLASVEDLG